MLAISHLSFINLNITQHLFPLSAFPMCMHCAIHKMMNTYMICIMSKSKLELKCPLSGLPACSIKVEEREQESIQRRIKTWNKI